MQKSPAVGSKLSLVRETMRERMKHDVDGNVSGRMLANEEGTPIPRLCSVLLSQAAGKQVVGKTRRQSLREVLPVGSTVLSCGEVQADPVASTDMSCTVYCRITVLSCSIGVSYPVITTGIDSNFIVFRSQIQWCSTVQPDTFDVFSKTSYTLRRILSFQGRA